MCMCVHDSRRWDGGDVKIDEYGTKIEMSKKNQKKTTTAAAAGKEQSTHQDV